MTQRTTAAALAAATAASLATVAAPQPASAHAVGVGFSGETCSLSSSHTTVRIHSPSGDGLGARCEWTRGGSNGGSARAINGTSSFTVAPGITEFRICQFVVDSGITVGCSSWVKA